VLTWNLAGINNSPYEFHNENNESFVRVVENFVKIEAVTYGKFLTEEVRKLIKTVPYYSGDSFPEDGTAVSTLFAKTIENDPFYIMVGNGDRYLKGRPTFESAKFNEDATLADFTKEWFGSMYESTKELNKLDDAAKKNSKYNLCSHLSHLYIRDAVLFQARLLFLRQVEFDRLKALVDSDKVVSELLSSSVFKFEKSVRKILPAWPQDNKQKLRSLLNAYKDEVDIFALQETYLKDVQDVVKEVFGIHYKDTFQVIYRKDAKDERQASILLLRTEKFEVSDVLSEKLNKFTKYDKEESKPEKEVVAYSVSKLLNVYV